MAKSDVNFGAILDTPSAAVERPKPLPVGTYLGVVQGMYETGQSSKKGTDFVEFTYKLVKAMDDVDAEALEAIGGLGEKTIKDAYYLTDNSIWRLKETLNAMGIEEGDRTLRERLDDTPNCTLLVQVRHETSQDGKATFARVANVAPAEE